MLNNVTISREELFALVWERPTTEVARELGISDVALGKLCSRLQVPKPPRGYWARVKAGQTLRRPPLAAFCAEMELHAGGRRHTETHPGRDVSVRLSPMQRDFLKRALQDLADANVDVTGCDLAYDGIRALAPELAAQVVILVQNRYQKWVEKGATTARSRAGAHQSISGLVAKLLTLAKEQVVIFQRKDWQGLSGDHGPTIIVRLSSMLQQRIAQVSRLIRENKLSYVACELGVADHAWSVRQFYGPNSSANISCELCISFHEVWVRCEMKTTWDSHTERFETGRLSLRQLVPVDLIPCKDIQLPANIRSSRLRPYAGRLQALQEAEEMYETLSTTAYEMERAVPDERLAMADRLWFGNGEKGPFVTARRAWRELEQDMERWEESLEAERAELCRDVLGIEKGDIVVCESRGQVQRIQVDGAGVYVHDSKVVFHLSGARFRKDGLPGKRQEYFTLQVENDLEKGAG